MIQFLLALLLLLPTSQPVNFAVIGDYGLAGINEENVARLVDGQRPEFVVTVGDNNYPYGAASTIENNIGKYYGHYFEQGFYPSLGNHDWITPNAQPYLDYFDLPNNERYYDIVKGPVHLFIIDSDPHEPDGVTFDSIQAQWLEQKLAHSTARWQLVFFHHAPYSSGLHGNSIYMQWPFAEWGADAVIAGHDHHYERLEKNGIPYFVNGVGGEGVRAIPNVAPESRFRYNGDFGAMIIWASEKQAEFKFVNVQGQLIDRFIIK